ncbi:MAG: glycosyltransferase family 2 protein [Flavobacteriales bacterium]|nr:glycosyltransferase family 2 protein [Flavobacteriales bacterium]MDP4952664.1 glycosyltransferase family 2 protein [Flavobacteriales bacterium]
MLIDVIIPAWNEEQSIAKVIADLPASHVREVVVVDNNSTDQTSKVAAEAGATVLLERKQGYGAACLKGIAHVNKKALPPDIIVFIDGDYSDYPEQLPELVAPIINEGMDMVIGSRAIGQREKGAMMPQQIFGNWLATSMMRVLYGVRFTDLGPFRAITTKALNAIEMKDQTYGWTVEMQVKAAKKGLKFTEVAMNYKRRIGVSKVSGTLKGTILAGYKIITTILKYR